MWLPLGAICSATLELQKIGFVCRFIDDEPTLMWGKLVFLAPFALSTTAAIKPSARFFPIPWRLWRGVRSRACALPLLKGETDAEAYSRRRWLCGNMRSSMQKDVERHNPPELDAIAGHPARRSEALDRGSGDEEAGCCSGAASRVTTRLA